MKVPCGVIRDLLPLYAENLAGEESKKLVEEHLSECETCQKELANLKGGSIQPVEKLPFKQVEKSLKKQRLKLAALILCATAAVLLTVFNFLTMPQYLPLEDSGVKITEYEDGTISVSLGGLMTAHSVETHEDDQGGQILDIYTWRTDMDALTGSGQAAAYFSLDDISAVYYCVPGEENQLIWAKDGWEPEGGVATLPRLTLNAYLLIAGGAALLLGICWLIFRKTKAGPVFAGAFFLPVSYMAAHFLIKGSNSATCTLLRDFLFIILTALALYGACLGVLFMAREKFKK